MMLVDFGNSRVKWVSVADGRWGEVQAAVHRGATLSAVLERAWGGMETPAAVVAACVAGPSVRETAGRWIERHWGLRAQWAESAAQCGRISNGYDDPSRLGIDRWLAVIGAAALAPGGACVVDAGTALTVDVVDAGGRHEGGIIAPGRLLMARALADGTGSLAAYVADLPDAAPGVLERDSPAAIAQGARLAVLGAVDRVLADARARHGAGLPLVVTGGDAAVILGAHPGARHEPDLVLKGLDQWRRSLPESGGS